MDHPQGDRRARAPGVTIDELAALCDVTTRTIRRDLQALEEAGFPIFDDRSRDDGRTRWSLNGQAFKGLAAGLTVSELCALLLQSDARRVARRHALPRRRAERLREARIGADAAHAPVRGSAPAGDCRQARSAAPPGGRCPADSRRARSGGDAASSAGVAHLPFAFERTDQDVPGPSVSARIRAGRTVSACLRPGIREVRTFAVERIQELSLLEERFTPIEELGDDAFPNSLGVHTGPTERVAIEFQQAVADYVRAREWHRSQSLTPIDRGRPDDPRRLPGSGAEELDPELRAVREGGCAGVAGAGDCGSIRKGRALYS